MVAKLDERIKALPMEEPKTKTHRPDRELLEEILALVRNQNRSDSFLQPPSSKVLRSRLAEKVREYTLRQEIKDTLEENGEKDYTIEKSSHLLTEDDIYFVHTKSGGSLKILLPADSLLEEAVIQARIQVERYFMGLQERSISKSESSEMGDG